MVRRRQRPERVVQQDRLDVQEEDRSARILIVDDVEANLTILQEMLGHAGYADVVATQDSSSVVDLFERLSPDLVLLDLRMPPPDGYTLLELLRSRIGPDDVVPLIVLTADVSLEAKARALGAGAHDLLTKPFHYAELLLRVRNALAVRARHRELRVRAAAVTAQLEERLQADRLAARHWQQVRRRVEAVLRAGIPMVFQPIVDLMDGALVGVEALARFDAIPVGTSDGQTEWYGPRPPAAWFADAASVALGEQLELLAVHTALESLRLLPPGAFLSINASAATITAAPFAALLSGHAEAHRLVVELTEHDRVDAYDRLLAALCPLRERGVRLAVDDTGAGWSGLQHILRLSPDLIKLDRALIVGLDRDPARRALVAALRHFAADTGCTVVAEGVETPAELAALRELGVRNAQGYLLSEPVEVGRLVPEAAQRARSAVVPDGSGTLGAAMRPPAVDGSVPIGGGGPRPAEREADRVRGDRLSRMSHELRTPLNAVIGFAEILGMEALTASQQDALRHLRTASAHLLDLIDDVLDIAQIEAGAMNLCIDPVPVGALLAAAVTLVRPMADAAGVGIDLEVGPVERWVRADRQRSLQILLNLLSNAVKYNRVGGVVAVRSELVGERVRLLVSDQGRGIAAGDRHRLFEPFDRLGQELSGIEGTGVGLTLAQSLAEHMGGTLELVASGPHGSTFAVELPAAPPIGTDPLLLEGPADGLAPQGPNGTLAVRVGRSIDLVDPTAPGGPGALVRLQLRAGTSRQSSEPGA
ncbi:MAG: EAL domain-containing protein [Acidimicrobiales bacterium]|nr:EAL domain-containing protein [Acidimicrobiales bacterium]